MYFVHKTHISILWPFTIVADTQFTEPKTQTNKLVRCTYREPSKGIGYLIIK